MSAIVEYMDKTKQTISGRAIDMFLGRTLLFEQHVYFIVTGLNGVSRVRQDGDPLIEGALLLEIDLNESYRSNLRNLSKCYFDCFARGCVIPVDMGNNLIRQTTLCQLTFYQWARKFCVIEYIQQQLAKLRCRPATNVQIKSALVREVLKPVETPSFRIPAEFLE